MRTATNSSFPEVSPIPNAAVETDSPPPTMSRGRMINLDTSVPRRAMTEREKQLLRLICDGMTNIEIAKRLDVSTETVKSELKRIFRKIEVRNRTQAAVMLIKQGLA